MTVDSSVTGRRLRKWAVAGICFITIAALLVGLNWSTISVTHVEAGDFAANSLLVQQAKELNLLTGHYSRFGFYHPGPALLYVLAFGEWLAHDLLHATPSAFSGQLVAVSFFGAAWIMLLAWLVRLWARDWRLPVLAVLTFLLVVTLFDHQFINGAWFPLMYSLPFAALAVSLGAIAAGFGRAAPAAALAAGVLINGHASFLTLVTMLSGLMLAANVLLSRRDPERCILSRTWVARHRIPLVWTLIILGVLLLPLAVRTIADPPGPVADYLRYGGNQQPNGLVDAFRFTAQYWGGPAPLSLAMLVMLFLLNVENGRGPSPRAVRGLVASCIASTLAVLVFAVFGVDSLDHAYLGYFAYSIPGVLALAVITALWRSAGHRLPLVAVMVIAIALVSVLLPQHVTRAVPPDYDRTEVVSLKEAIERAADGGPVVLDLDSSGDWSTVWSTVAALHLLSAREGVRLTCIDENWSILFTDQARCSPRERGSAQRFLVVAGESSGATIRGAGVALVPQAPRRGTQ